MRVENLLKFNTEIIFYNHYRNTGSEFQLSVVKFLILNSIKSAKQYQKIHDEQKDDEKFNLLLRPFLDIVGNVLQDINCKPIPLCS